MRAAGNRVRHFARESPGEGHQESTIMQALEIADEAASIVWERAGDKTAVERLRLSLQAATVAQRWPRVTMQAKLAAGADGAPENWAPGDLHCRGSLDAPAPTSKGVVPSGLRIEDVFFVAGRESLCGRVKQRLRICTAAPAAASSVFAQPTTGSCGQAQETTRTVSCCASRPARPAKLNRFHLTPPYHDIGCSCQRLGKHLV
jgi:hypothetical protein